MLDQIFLVQKERRFIFLIFSFWRITPANSRAKKRTHLLACLYAVLLQNRRLGIRCKAGIYIITNITNYYTIEIKKF